jgi:hypothetical protein
MGNATVIAELIAQGRGGLGPRLGQVCRSALASEDFGGHAAGEMAASRLSVQAIVAGR